MSLCGRQEAFLVKRQETGMRRMSRNEYNMSQEKNRKRGGGQGGRGVQLTTEDRDRNIRETETGVQTESQRQG